MKIVYIAGPYRAETHCQVFANIARARAAAEFVWSHGAAAVCPHLNSAFMSGLVPEAAFLEGDLEIMRRCDAVLLCCGDRFEHSEGTIGEVNCASEHGIPVFVSTVQFLEWLEA